MENVVAKLVRQAAAKTSDLAGDTTTSVVLAQGLIAGDVKGVCVCVICISLSACKVYSIVDNVSVCYNQNPFKSVGGCSWRQPCSNHSRFI